MCEDRQEKLLDGQASRSAVVVDCQQALRRRAGPFNPPSAAATHDLRPSIPQGPMVMDLCSRKRQRKSRLRRRKSPRHLTGAAARGTWIAYVPNENPNTDGHGKKLTAPRSKQRPPGLSCNLWISDMLFGTAKKRQGRFARVALARRVRLSACNPT